METILPQQNNSLANPGGVIALVAGDRDYKPLLEKAQEHNWQTETHFWTHGMAKSLKKISTYYPLDSHYKSLMYIIGRNPTKRMYKLKIDNIIKNWEWNENIMKCFSTLELLGWWNWMNDKSAFLYFDDKKQLEDAKYSLMCKYPNIRAGEMQRSNNGPQI